MSKFTERQLKLIKALAVTCKIHIGWGGSFTQPEPTDTFSGYTKTDLKECKTIIKKIAKHLENE